MECSSIKGTFNGIEIKYILKYTGDYVLFKTIDGKLHCEKKEFIDIER